MENGLEGGERQVEQGKAVGDYNSLVYMVLVEIGGAFVLDIFNR